MMKPILGLLLSVSAAASFACPDGMKVMDAKAPSDHKVAISEQPAWTAPKAEATKVKASKPAAAKPAVGTAATTAETKKAPGV
jgi:hypothetical protein